jgi:hypothetical protein
VFVGKPTNIQKFLEELKKGQGKKQRTKEKRKLEE